MRQRQADALRIGGVQRFTSIDYPGALAAVVFVQGCPWRCVYCHNPQLQPRAAPAAAASAAPRWPEVRDWLRQRRGLLDAVVFSGGEPTQDAALPAAAAEARALGYRIGLHTAGMLPRRLGDLLPLLDWVGLDVKAPLADAALHDRITGVRSTVRGGAAAVRESLRLLQQSGIDFECRTTVPPALLPTGALHALGAELAQAGVRHYALQACRTAGAPAADIEPLRDAMVALRPLFESFEDVELRGDV